MRVPDLVILPYGVGVAMGALDWAEAVARSTIVPLRSDFHALRRRYFLALATVATSDAIADLAKFDVVRRQRT